jgi:hypothetical protein
LIGPPCDRGAAVHGGLRRRRNAATTPAQRPIVALVNGGGFMVLLVDPERRALVRERLRKLIHVNVGFDIDGSKIVIFSTG